MKTAVPMIITTFLSLGMTTILNVSRGYIRSVVVKFSQTDAQAVLIVRVHPEWIKLQNLMIEKIGDWGTEEREAYVKAKNPNKANFCSLEIAVVWMFLDENNADHWITATAEVTYFNGTVWKRVGIPIELGVFVS